LLFLTLLVGANSQLMRCGRSWEDATSRCGTACPSGFDEPCPSGEHCFRDVAPCSGTGTTPPVTYPPPTYSPPVVTNPPVATPSGTFVGIWYWTWSSGTISPPAGINRGIAFSGHVNPSNAIAESNTIYSRLPGQKIISLGGGNGAGAWSAANLRQVTAAIRAGTFDAYSGIAFDIEEGESGLSSLFAEAFAATKAKGKTCIVTVSHSAPYGIGDAGTVMRSLFRNTNIDYLSPQLYTTGYETANDWAESRGVSWNEYAGSRAKIIPSIVTSSLYEDARRYFLARGVTTAGYIQWQQAPASFKPLRCGVSWADANSRCSAASCPNGQDSSCPNGQRCYNNVALCAANANEATVVEEQQQDPTTTSSNNEGVGEKVPAWAIALLALGSILVVGVIAALVVLLKTIHHSERV